MSSGRAALATNFGGGGAFGYGFNMGVALGLRDGGLDLTRYPMIGTSAGSHTVATLRTGLDFDEFCDLWAELVGDRTSGFMEDGYEFSGQAYRGLDDDGVAAVATRIPWRQRDVLESSQFPIADIVTASSAAVPVLRPHKVGEHWYVDGGVVSLASGDLTVDADVMLFVTPFARRRGQGPAGWVGARQAEREIRAWVTRTGGDVLHVLPTTEMVTLGGKRLRDIVDIRIGRAVFPLAREYGLRVADELRSMKPSLFDPGSSDSGSSDSTSLAPGSLIDHTSPTGGAPPTEAGSSAGSSEGSHQLVANRHWHNEHRHNEHR